MTGSKMRLVPQPALAPCDKAAKRTAWAMVADGFRAALQTPGLALDDRAQFMRMMRKANRLCGRAELYAVNSQTGRELGDA